MTEYIYGDVLFIIDFSMDFFCLYLTGKLLHIKMRAWRVILAAALGALYGVTSLLYDLPTALSVTVEIAAAFAVCAVGLFCGRARNLLLGTAVFYAVSALLGGIMTLIYSKLGKYRSFIEIKGSVKTAIGDVPLWVFAVCAVASVLITRLLSRLLKRKNAETTCEIAFVVDGKKYEMTGLVDSGNICADPISGTPVVFVSSKYSALVPAYEDGATVLPRGCRIVPVKTATGSELVFARKAEMCRIVSGGDVKEREALIAVGKEENYGGCDALVPLELI